MLPSTNVQSSALIFSIASRGYALAFRRCLRSHRRYASDKNVTYTCVCELPAHSAMEAAWLKIPLLIAALKKGWKWVVWLDADTEIQPDCPDFRTLEQPDQDVYLAKGHSGRVNAGVIIVRNSANSLHLFENIFDSCEVPVARENQAPFENGHVIQFSQGKDFVYVIDRKWNNSAMRDGRDFIRHYTGPMRGELPLHARVFARYGALWRHSASSD